MLTNEKKINIASAIPRRLKWGVAGCGNFAEFTFLPSLQNIKRSKLISVFSHDIERARYISQKYGASGFYDDFNKFLESDIDVVYISGKNSDHFQHVIKAAKAGRNILCERPIALNSEQAKEMVDVCKENNVLIAVNHLHRFHPLIIKAKELIDKQLLGKLISLSASYHIDKAPDSNFRFIKEYSGGGVLRDLGSQVIDLMRFFGGNIVEVKAFMDNIIYKSQVEDFAGSILRFERGHYGNFNVSYNIKKPFITFDIIGANGSISIESSFDKKNVSSKLIIDLQGEARKVFRKKVNKVSFMIKSVQRSFLRNQQPLVTGEDGLLNMNLIEEIERQCGR